MPDEAWGQATGRRRNRPRQGPRPEVAALAQELRQALFVSPPRAGGGRGAPGQLPGRQTRRPEWSCPACGVQNFMDRAVCRACGGAPAPPAQRNSGANQPPQARAVSRPRRRLPPGSAWAEPQPAARRQTNGGSRAAALEEARAAAADAGAPDEALEAMDQRIETLRAESRPLGARIDSAQAKVRKTAERLQRAQAAVAAAHRQQEEALQAHAEAEDALAELNQQLPAPDVPRQGQLITGITALLNALEGSALTVPGGNGPPEAVLARMHDMHVLLGAVEEPRGDDLDNAFGSEPAPDADFRGEPDAAQQDASPAPAARPRRSASPAQDDRERERTPRPRGRAVGGGTRATAGPA